MWDGSLVGEPQDSDLPLSVELTIQEKKKGRTRNWEGVAIYPAQSCSLFGYQNPRRNRTTPATPRENSDLLLHCSQTIVLMCIVAFTLNSSAWLWKPRHSW